MIDWSLVNWFDFVVQSIFWLGTCFCGRWLLHNMEVLADGNIGGAKDGESTVFK